MENTIININYETEQPTISARELHKEVGSTERFSTWFNRQLQFGFVENEDYIGCKKFNTLARQELQDYNLSVDMAKQICMVQKNERARAVRQYLIDLEKAWNTPEQVMARALKMADNTINKLKENNYVLIQKNQQLNTDNKALSGKLLDWADRDRINAGIRKLAASTGTRFGDMYKELYKNLEYSHKIYLNSRLERDKNRKKNASCLDYVRDNEWAKILKTFCAMCEAYDKSPNDMMQQITPKDKLSVSDGSNNEDKYAWLEQL